MQRRHRQGLLLILAAINLATAGYEPRRATAQPSERPAVERCRDFCGRIYGEDNDESEECAVACHEADACHRSCKEKLGADVPKVQKCLRACMHRGEERPEEPEEKPIQL